MFWESRPGTAIRYLVCVFFGLTVLPASVCAQGTPVLSLLDPTGTLAAGGEVQGALSSSDYVSAEGNYLDAWALQGTQGQSLTIDLMSDDFDAYLFVVGPGLSETLMDDDSGGACHARITLTFLEDGQYHVVASSVGSRSTGVYALRASSQPEPPLSYPCGGIDPGTLTALPTEGRSLRMGEPAFGELAPGSPVIGDGQAAQAWALDGEEGKEVVVTLESDAFDAYLYVVGPGLSAALTDDDGAGDLNARIQFRFPQNDAYRVVASAVSSSSYGAYTLRVEEPVDPNTLPTEDRIAEMGGTAQGVLTDRDPVAVDGRRGQAWALYGTAGTSVVVELISEDFDSYLYLVGPGIETPLSDDESAGHLNSRIEHTFAETGTYRVIVSAVSASETGEFTLRVSAR
jgi:hypothetical protein